MSTIIRDPDEISMNFRDHNIKHFAQASGCRLSKEEYQDVKRIAQLNYLGLSQDVDLLLFREEINQDAIAQNSKIIEFDAWTNKLKLWKESTSTSPSGLHLGHFKACTEVMYVQNN